MPSEYQRAGESFDAFLMDVRDACELGSRHQAYTTVQGVFQVFRRRLALVDPIRFAAALPGLVRALFVAEWDPGEPQLEFGPRQAMETEVRALRSLHNFAPEGSIGHVAWALRRHADAAALGAALAQLPPPARDYWRADDETSSARAAAWRALGPPLAN